MGTAAFDVTNYFAVITASVWNTNLTFAKCFTVMVFIITDVSCFAKALINMLLSGHVPERSLICPRAT